MKPAISDDAGNFVRKFTEPCECYWLKLANLHIGEELCASGQRWIQAWEVREVASTLVLHHTRLPARKGARYPIRTRIGGAIPD
jgi:hypothetical protein